MAPHIDSFCISSGDFPVSDNYPFNLEVVRRTCRLDFDCPVTLFVGENGSGKSTILEALARSCGIYIWRSEHGARYQHNPHEKALHQHMSVKWSQGKVPGAFFGSDHFKDFTHQLEDWASTDPGQLAYFGGESLVTRSHGQSMMAYFRSRYALKGLYLLDEPETALSPRSQLQLMEIIGNNSRAGHAQFIITTHSPLLLTLPDARVYNFDTAPVSEIEYEETDLYRTYRDFFIGKEQEIRSVIDEGNTK